MKTKIPNAGTSTTILRLACQLVAKRTKPGESMRSVQRNVERMVEFLESQTGVIDLPAPVIGVEPVNTNLPVGKAKRHKERSVVNMPKRAR